MKFEGKVRLGSQQRLTTVRSKTYHKCQLAFAHQGNADSIIGMHRILSSQRKSLLFEVGAPHARSVIRYRWGFVTPSTRVGRTRHNHLGESTMSALRKFWNDEQGQDIAEYAVMLAVILVIVIGTVRLIGTQANTVFSQAASSIQ